VGSTGGAGAAVGSTAGMNLTVLRGGVGGVAWSDPTACITALPPGAGPAGGAAGGAAGATGGAAGSATTGGGEAATGGGEAAGAAAGAPATCGTGAPGLASWATLRPPMNCSL